MSLIKQAAAACDRLIMALNSDASVRRLKGPSRPIQDEESRAAVMGALKGVSAVVLFDEDTPLELIKALQPDILVKGAPIIRKTMSSAPRSSRRAAAASSSRNCRPDSRRRSSLRPRNCSQKQKPPIERRRGAQLRAGPRLCVTSAFQRGCLRRLQQAPD
ncbi:hypothetical protein [Methylocella tundrae]|uniref:hypothetical protein n=1 Tax=Methylocella tundrae TaxID=227605 RepID=UPI001FCE987F|nr:hypothetical protein [Methylocella tundrae]